MFLHRAVHGSMIGWHREATVYLIGGMIELLIKIGDFDCTECWDGVFYKKLSNYPDITEWEIQTIIDFAHYEAKHGRSCEIEAEETILSQIREHREAHNKKRILVPAKITECIACPKYKGCMTDFVCHTSPIENAIQIFDCGSLLSAVRARGKSAKELKSEERNAANDPEDYFNYIMFAWGNCQAGDRLVMERKLGRFPNEEDLSTGFTLGVRFFFRYNDIIHHPDAVFDGVLPLKIENEVILKDWVYAIIVPTIYENIISEHIPVDYKEKVYFVENDCRDIWDWSEKVYEFVKKI